MAVYWNLSTVNTNREIVQGVLLVPAMDAARSRPAAICTDAKHRVCDTFKVVLASFCSPVTKLAEDISLRLLHPAGG